MTDRHHILVFWLLLVLLFTAEAHAVDVRTWTFEATVVELWDPGFVSNDVRLGDTVSGTFSYDLDVPPDADNLDDWADYSFSPGYPGIQLAIENPRTDSQIDYLPLVNDRSHSWMQVTTASAFDGESAMFLFQNTVPPKPDWFAFIYMEFSGGLVLSDLALPAELDLDVWPAVFFILWTDPLSDGLLAQLHTITPVISADYNASGGVDLDDLNLVLFNWNVDGETIPTEWVHQRPLTGEIAGLDQLNGVPFNWGNTALLAGTTVPEPASQMLLVSCVAVGMLWRRRRIG